jgi:hypothetical protein
MVLRAGFKKKLRLYVELKICDKNRRKITGPQCVKCGNKERWLVCTVVEIITRETAHDVCNCVDKHIFALSQVHIAKVCKY